MSRGPLAYFGLAIALTWLVQPVSVVTAPLALLSLGASSTGPAFEVSNDRERRWLTAIATALALLSLVQSVRMIEASRQVEIAERTRSVSAIQAARSRFPGDPTLSDVEAQIRSSLAASGDAVQREGALAAARRTVEMEPSRHLWWYNLARYEYLYGPGSARERRALTKAAVLEGQERFPWSLALLQTQHELANLEGDAAETERVAARLCELGFCPPEAND